jgi:hypothetical protein
MRPLAVGARSPVAAEMGVHLIFALPPSERSARPGPSCVDRARLFYVEIAERSGNRHPPGGQPKRHDQPTRNRVGPSPCP